MVRNIIFLCKTEPNFYKTILTRTMSHSHLYYFSHFLFFNADCDPLKSFYSPSTNGFQTTVWNWGLEAVSYLWFSIIFLVSIPNCLVSSLRAGIVTYTFSVLPQAQSQCRRKTAGRHVGKKQRTTWCKNCQLLRAWRCDNHYLVEENSLDCISGRGPQPLGC